MRTMQTQFSTTFFFATHDPHLIAQADTTITMRDGALLETGSIAP
jgi:ABC-type lipoprotein export system ATPase subunit